MTCPFHFNRRTFLAGAATATAALGVQATTQAQQAESPRGDGTPRSDNATVNNPEARLEFHGEHQQGIINQPQKYAEIVALDIQQGDRARLEQQLGAFRNTAAEMEQTNLRLRDQLRRLDAETVAALDVRLLDMVVRGLPG